MINVDMSTPNRPTKDVTSPKASSLKAALDGVDEMVISPPRLSPTSVESPFKSDESPTKDEGVTVERCQRRRTLQALLRPWPHSF